jgi:hypothetical protein
MKGIKLDSGPEPEVDGDWGGWLLPAKKDKKKKKKVGHVADRQGTMPDNIGEVNVDTAARA